MTTIAALSVGHAKIWGHWQCVTSPRIIPKHREHRSRGPARGGHGKLRKRRRELKGSPRLQQQPRGMKVKTHLINTAALGALVVTLGAVLFITAPAQAGGNCDRNNVSIDGAFGGESFAVPARLGPDEEGNNIGLSEKSCEDNKRDARRSAGVAAAMDTFGSQPGLNLTLGYANIGLEDDVNAAAGVVHYRHDFANPGVFHSITGKAGFGADTTGDELGASVGLTLSFGTF